MYDTIFWHSSLYLLIQSPIYLYLSILSPIYLYHFNMHAWFRKVPVCMCLHKVNARPPSFCRGLFVNIFKHHIDCLSGTTTFKSQTVMWNGRTHMHIKKIQKMFLLVIKDIKCPWSQAETSFVILVLAHSSQRRIVGKVDGQFFHARRWTFKFASYHISRFSAVGGWIFYCLLLKPYCLEWLCTAK